MPPRPILTLALLAAPLLAACAGAPEPATEAAGLRDALLNMRASLAAAAGTAEGVAAPPGAATPRRPSASLVASAMPDRAAPPAPGPDRQPDRAAAGAPRQPPAAGEPPLMADQLLGRTPDHLRSWLGEPALRRPEGSAAEIWLYASEACALDLVLYRDRAGRMRVGFAAARARGEPGQGTTEAECLRAIAAGPPSRPAT